MVHFPIVNLVADRTPIQPLTQLSSLLGVDLWMKRDDLAGTTLGGNKARQLEYYLGAAVAEEADTILITGAVQSNFVRIAAASAASLGMQTVIQLEDRVDRDDLIYRQSGNVLLNSIFGSRVIYYPHGEDENGADAALFAEAKRLRKQGKTPYVIPLGMQKPPLGALGYIHCAEELQSQAPEFDFAVVGSGSGLTHLGLVAGFKVTGAKTVTIGSCVRRPEDQQHKRLQDLAVAFDKMQECPGRLNKQDFEVWDGALAPGYGQLGPVAAQAMSLLGSYEGHIVDPTYTAKSFAAIPALVKSGRIPKGSRVVFIHTGGLGAVFAYQEDIRLALNDV